jgi:hypothetical protein
MHVDLCGRLARLPACSPSASTSSLYPATALLTWPLSFNADHAALACRKRADANRIIDVNVRLEELDRELAKLALVPAEPVPTGAAGAPLGGARRGSGAPGGSQQGAAARRTTGGESAGEATSAVAASAALGGGGPVVVRWADVEDLEEALFTLKPGEIQVGRGL